MVLISTLLFGCSSHDAEENSQIKEVTLEDTTEITKMVDTLVPNIDSTIVDSSFVNSPEITTFNGFPEKIDGCSCYFSFNQEDLDDWNFIYADDYHFEVGYISLNGDLIELDLKNPENNAYTVEFEIEKEEQTGYEVHTQWGIMTIIGPEGEQYKAKYVGECGC